MPVLELDANKHITASYLYGADGVVYRRKHNAVAHWHFDEGTGTIAPDVDGGNHGTLGGGVAAKTPTWSFGCGLLFDGVDDLLQVPDSDSLDLAGDKLIGDDNSTHRFHGYLDDVSIYARALSDSEIVDLAKDVDKRYEYHHLNALGSNIVLTDDNQKVLVRYEYDVFGAIRAETGTSDNTRKFTGKEFDADCNLYYYAARYYDPYIGRFTQRDPAEDGVNWYAYTYNNPVKFIDPTGITIVLLGP